ncbi:hypothetical protein AK812_SmicGene41357 [Symbiodinium microadriaticum]|uniref:Uncharacterized protein n=1 Tax=Symbiodinium microadriaticum TaxID=2951 RepID=A0A1Q9C6C6_SYMMI|nr:hypothetical protein AK812_SmicGene41357 [Symbiodinium microadriaticum]
MEPAASFADVPRIVWMLWFQGWDTAPPLCVHMLQTWRLFNPTWDIRAISRANFPALLGDSFKEYQALRQQMNLGDKLGLSPEQREAFGEATNLCRRPLDDWLPDAAANGFFAFYPDLQSPEHHGVPHIISSFIVTSPGHPVVVEWLRRTRLHWSKRYSERPDLEYLWVNKLFRQLTAPPSQGGDMRCHKSWAEVPKISCEHGKTGPMRFYSGPEALAAGARLFEDLLAPPSQQLISEVEEDVETPMWKLAFREKLESDSAYWYILARTVARAAELPKV